MTKDDIQLLYEYDREQPGFASGLHSLRGGVHA